MSNSALVIGIVVAIFVVFAIALIVKSQRSQRLKSRFGPEYKRAVEETGSKTQAEAKLEKLAKRVQSFKINDLPPAARADFVSAEDPGPICRRSQDCVNRSRSAYSEANDGSRLSSDRVRTAHRRSLRRSPPDCRTLPRRTRYCRAALARTRKYGRHEAGDDSLPHTVCRIGWRTGLNPFHSGTGRTRLAVLQKIPGNRRAS